MATAACGDDMLLWALPSGRPVGAPRPLPLQAFGDVRAASAPTGGLWPSRVRVGIEIVDAATVQRRAALPDPAAGASARFTPDGRFLCRREPRGWARLWSTATWQPAAARARRPHRRGLRLAVSPDGRTLATGSMDGTVRLFDLRTQRAARRAAARPCPTASVAPEFTPDGAYLFASPTPGAPTAGTSARPRGRATRARSPAARSRAPSGATSLPEREYEPAC